MNQPEFRIVFLFGKLCFSFFSRVWVLTVLIFCVYSLASTAQTADTQALSKILPASPALATQSKSKTVSENIAPSNQTTEKLVHYGDVLEIDVLGSTDFDWRGKLDDAGFLAGLPNIAEPIMALCQTEDEIAAEIAAAYSKILRKPEVVVRTLDRSTRERAVLLGAVRTAQRFQLERPARLNELIVIAGGITDRASGEVTIFRPANVACAAPGKTASDSNTMRVKLTDLLGGKPDANPLVRAGDVVTVEEAAPIYVTGGVVAPQRILFRSGLTVSRAVASAGGLNRNADRNKIFVFRRQKDRADLQIIETDFDKIMRKNGEDVPLEPYDIVEVAQTGRAREKTPPIVAALDSAARNAAQLPLRIIN